jgi:serine phosphatase RsbU (regulator of sigma subunit)
VKSNNEFGQLALAFNRMAEDLSLQQQKLVEGERARKEQEFHQRVLAVEYERKSDELEEARRFQLSMLPKHVPELEKYDVAVYTRTATEVGGDYYDFHVGKENVMTVAIGDATGHGAKAGTMVTVVKTLFAGYGGATMPAEFLHDAAQRIKRMELGRMSMALTLARLEGRRLTVASAGMPPVLIHRGNHVEEIALEATPLGTLGTDYAETTVKVAAGDTILFMTDGFPELLNDAGQQLGYVASQEAFAAAATAPTSDGVVAKLVATAAQWHGEHPPNDDVTFVVVRVR